jgi:hypothetical protein
MISLQVSLRAVVRGCRDEPFILANILKAPDTRAWIRPFSGPKVADCVPMGLTLAPVLHGRNAFLVVEQAESRGRAVCPS